MKILILAGGSGTRLWPLSRDRYPKQFIKLMGGKTTLFQETFLRSLKLAKAEDIYVITNIKYKFLVMGEVEELGIVYPEANILVEPEAKNTLPAIYYGVHALGKDSTDSVVVFPSDHLITNSAGFTQIIRDSEALTATRLVTFGIQPDSPNTGYGYIQPGAELGNGFAVERFREKPDMITAQKYVDEGYAWNSGIFMFNAALFTEELITHSPYIHAAFELAANPEEAFGAIEKGISIDYGMMEKSSRVAVVPVDIGWNDLGSFDSFYEVFDADSNGNITTGENHLIDASNNLIHSEAGKAVAVIGVEDLIVIDQRDALLICKRDQSQKVKDVVMALQKKGDRRTEFHFWDYRPWGHYRVLEEEKDSFKIKRITVLPGKRLSYQLHHHRSEHWVVVKGMARVTSDDSEVFVRAGESIFMKAGQKHRLENPGKTTLEIIEVQMGEYLEEDDIIRFEDAYGRI